MSVETTDPSAADLMNRRFLAVAPEDTLGEAAERLAAARTGSALVVEFGRLTGILTSRDLLHAVAERVHPSEARVREWMTVEPVTCSAATAADEAARLMLQGSFHHLPVTENGRPIGVVGLRSVIGALRPAWPGF